MKKQGGRGRKEVEEGERAMREILGRGDKREKMKRRLRMREGTCNISHLPSGGCGFSILNWSSMAIS